MEKALILSKREVLDILSKEFGWKASGLEIKKSVNGTTNNDVYFFWDRYKKESTYTAIKTVRRLIVKEFPDTSIKATTFFDHKTCAAVIILKDKE